MSKLCEAAWGERLAGGKHMIKCDIKAEWKWRIWLLISQKHWRKREFSIRFLERFFVPQQEGCRTSQLKADLSTEALCDGFPRANACFPPQLPSSFLTELLASKDVGLAGCLGTPWITGSLDELIWKALQEVPVQPPASHMASHEFRWGFSGLYLDYWIFACIIQGLLLSWTVLWLVLSGSLVSQSQSWLVVKCTIFQIAQVEKLCYWTKLPPSFTFILPNKSCFAFSFLLLSPLTKLSVSVLLSV